jgi:DNA-binding MarR family transcriptional regulator
MLTMKHEDLIPSHICTAMMRLGTRMAAVFDQAFTPMGMTQALFRTLLAVWEQGGEEGITPSALADYLLIERASVTILTQRLVEQGLVERRPGENRRTFRLTLTEAGRARLEEFAPHAVALANKTLSEFSPESLAQFWEMLQQLETRIRSLPAEGKSPDSE